MYPDIELLRSIKTFTQLVKYLRDKLDWPIESENFDDLTFDYEPEELGIDAKTAVKIKEIKQLRPLTSRQPWGIFFINFEPKQLPIVVLRRILRSLVIKKRGSANKAQQAAWNLHDLLFISSYGESEHREITFAHFSEPNNRLFGDLPTLRVLGWDDDDTKLKIDHVVHTLSEKMRWPEDEDDSETWRKKWSDAFELRPREVITTSKDLAIRLADLAKSIRQRANLILNIESERGDLRKMHKAFQTALIHDLNQDDFADMYAQTIAYGLLAARVSRPAGIVADNLADMVPITNPFLKDMLGTFLSIGGRKGKIDFDELGIQEVVDLLNNPDTHMEAILRDFGKRTMQEDPVIHFYELFLKEYDKKKKVERGVFYTPQPVVSYIIRSVHELLQKEFGLEDGLASTITWGEMAKRNPHIKIPEGVSPDEHFVQMLDPATGTATFLVEIIEVIYQTMISKWRKEKYTEFELGDLWNEYVPKHLLPRLYGFELMMAPYAIAHMKIGLKLAETGYKFRSDERAHIYLTNSLEPPSDMAEQPEFEEWSPALAHEAKAVNAVKRKKRFTVVVGNPPYSKISANLSEDAHGRPTFIGNLIEDYKFIDGKPLEERNPKWLQDDYVKFIRFIQWGIANAGKGIIGLITNHGYLDNPTFRGLRHSLLTSLNEIFIYNLHGNSRKREESPDGSEDHNVFDIQQGVAILLGCKQKYELVPARIHLADLWGTCESKYQRLKESDFTLTTWSDCSAATPSFLFLPQDEALTKEYDAYWLVTKIFDVYASTVTTARNDFSMAYDAETLTKRISDLRDMSINDKTIRERYGLKDVSYWTLPNARKQLREIKSFQHYVKPYCYRPFDFRLVFYHGAVCERLRSDVMRHMEKDNIALLTHRPQSPSDFTYMYCTNMIGDQCVAANKTGGGGNSFQFPLFLLPAEKTAQGDLHAETDRRLNIGTAFLKALAEKLGLLQDTSLGLPNGIAPEDIFNYAYAVFNSPGYRNRYVALLRIDFPRLPLTSNIELFKELAKLGGELVALHLMESPTLDRHMTRFISLDSRSESGMTKGKMDSRLRGNDGLFGKEAPIVEKVSYSDNTVWIDKAQTQGFQGVPENVWNFHIGGYQVCQKWLKDRKGRTLSADDINHYHRIVVALNETIRIMVEIDKVIEHYGGWPGAFQDKKEYTGQQEPLQKVAEEKPSYQPEKTSPTMQPPFPKKNDWKTWTALSVWAKTAPVNTYWIDFASTISNKIKKGSKLSAKDQADMEKCWKQAVKYGFRTR